MIEKDITIQYNKICDLIDMKHLKEAFDSLQNMIDQYGITGFKDEMLRLNTTYKYMLQYTLEGAEDPEQEKVYRKLQADTFFLTQHITEHILIEKSTRWVYGQVRAEAKLNNAEQLLEKLKSFHVEQELKNLVNDEESVEEYNKHHNNIKEMFHHFCFTSNMKEDSHKLARDIIDNNEIAVIEKSILISAVSMSCMRYFESEKINFLFDMYEQEPLELKERAIVGLLLIFYKYHKQIKLLPKIIARLELLSDTQNFKNDFENVLIQLIRSKQTEKIQRKMQDEILPKLVEVSPNLKEKLNIDDLLQDSMMEDKNPDWEEVFQDSPELFDSMKEISEMQMEGDDVFLSSFSMLKHFPFFQTMENWFYPFTKEHAELQDAKGNDDQIDTIVRSLQNAPILCSSDKYSFCLNLSFIPQEFKEMMIRGLEAEMEQAEEIEKGESVINTQKKTQTIIRNYTQDLYRFFKLFNHKDNFEDPFVWKMDFHNMPLFQCILKGNKSIFKNIAEYYFAKNYFEEAGQCFDLLLMEKTTGELLQKRAFCYQKLGNYNEAHYHYKKAELYDVNKAWNLKKIALCLRHCGKNEEALDYYRQVEVLEPENSSNQISIGYCLLDLGKTEDALSSFFKVEYLNPTSSRTFRPIGWCSFLAGKFEQSEKYYQKMIDLKPNTHDYINLGHVYWCTQKRKEALEAYKKSIELESNDSTTFFKTIEEDCVYLQKHGIKREEIPVLLDQLRYWLEE